MLCRFSRPTKFRLFTRYRFRRSCGVVCTRKRVFSPLSPSVIVENRTECLSEIKTILRETIVVCLLPLPLFAAGHLHCWARNESFGCLLEMARKTRHSPQTRWPNKRIHNAAPSVNRKIIMPRSHKGNYRYNVTQERNLLFRDKK